MSRQASIDALIVSATNTRWLLIVSDRSCDTQAKPSSSSESVNRLLVSYAEF